MAGNSTEVQGVKLLTNNSLKSERLSSQISKMILSEIQSGQLKPGDRLPTEIALAEKYGVSACSPRIPPSIATAFRPICTTVKK